MKHYLEGWDVSGSSPDGVLRRISCMAVKPAGVVTCGVAGRTLRGAVVQLSLICSTTCVVQYLNIWSTEIGVTFVVAVTRMRGNTVDFRFRSIITRVIVGNETNRFHSSS